MSKLVVLVLQSICLILFLPNFQCVRVSKVVEENKYSHLEYKHVQDLCNKTNAICTGNQSNICTAREINGNWEYKDFENSCFLFFTNMCEMPSPEFHIIQGGTCEDYLKWKSKRRNEESGDTTVTLDETTVETPEENTTDSETSPLDPTTPPPALRTSTKLKKLHEIEWSHDGHLCPMSCPDIYRPVCLISNALRGGKHVRFDTFVNHCVSDMYYCKNLEKFEPPPTSEPTIFSEELHDPPSVSELDWTSCAAMRYLEFARASEVISSMGHYGWLIGNDRYSRIIPPNERQQ